MPTLCPTCGHRPSQRISLAGHAAESCGCRCHDAADAAPALLAACKEYIAYREGNDGNIDEIAGRMKAAIRLAEIPPIALESGHEAG